jgi:hypothetical protein
VPRLDLECEFYPDDFLLPVASTDRMKKAMLNRWRLRRSLEILVESHICLGKGVRLIAFSREDCSSLGSLASALQLQAEIILRNDLPYVRCERYVQDVNLFIRQAVKDPRWMGKELDFDELQR